MTKRKRLWETKEEALRTINDRERDVMLLLDLFNERNASFETVGASLFDAVITLCEAALNICCWDKASLDGTLDFPRISDLCRDEYKDIFPKIVPVAGKEIGRIKREAFRNGFDIFLLEGLLSIAKAFINGLKEENLENSLELNEVADLLDHCLHGLKKPTGRPARNSERGRFGFIVLRKDEDEYTDEELDRIYRRKTKNADKYLAPVYIIDLMKRFSSEEKPIGVNETTRLLEEYYGCSMERKAVSRALVQLQEQDYLCVYEDGHGYWYDDERVSERVIGTP